MTDAELSALEKRRDRVLADLAWVRARICVLQDDAEVRLPRDIADLQGRMELLKLELQKLREAVEGED